MNKYERVAELLRCRLSSHITLLDIGCRNRELASYVHHLGDYYGADLSQTGAVDYVGDFTKGLPVESQRFDVVTALDVIEHTVDMTTALDEVMRVTKQFAIINLPNHAHFMYRLHFLLTGRINDKFDVQFPSKLDRHRWFTTARQTDEFMRGYAASRDFGLERVASNIGVFGPYLEPTLGRAWPDFWVRNRLYVLSRRTRNEFCRRPDERNPASNVAPFSQDRERVT